MIFLTLGTAIAAPITPDPALPTLSQQRTQMMEVAPDNAAGVYKVGDTVHWKIEWKGEAEPPTAHYTLKSGGLKEVGKGDLTFTNKVASLDTKFDAPGTVLLEVRWDPGNSANRATSGAVASPEKIVPAAPIPDDFDTFWESQLKELKKVPFNPVLEVADGGKRGVSYWKVSLDNIKGSHISGQLARPEKGEKLPALLIVQWAGVYPLQKGWVTDRASEGWLTLNIEPHDIPFDKPVTFYQEQSAGPLNNYPAIGNDSRETSYFLRMYLSCYQALEYLKSRSDWDGKTLVVMGTSQGGMQTMMLAGLHPNDITAALALVPAGADMLAPDAGRSPGWPQWYYQTGTKDPKKVREASRYYDVANFAHRVKCPMLIGLGLRDETCPPSSVFAAAHEIKSKKELVILPKSGHQNENGSQDPYSKICYGVWLNALRQGKSAPVEQVR